MSLNKPMFKEYILNKKYSTKNDNYIEIFHEYCLKTNYDFESDFKELCKQDTTTNLMEMIVAVIGYDKAIEDFPQYLKSIRPERVGNLILGL